MIKITKETMGNIQVSDWNPLMEHLKLSIDVVLDIGTFLEMEVNNRVIGRDTIKKLAELVVSYGGHSYAFDHLSVGSEITVIYLHQRLEK